MFKHIKGFLSDDTVFYGLLILVVGVGSFGLGRLSLTDTVQPSPASVVLSQTETPAPAATETQTLVASKNGSKYHYLWCPGAKQMKEDNKIFFASSAEARAAGYEPAANCQGLE